MNYQPSSIPLPVFLQSVNDRYVVFNNKGTLEQKSRQVKKLLLTVKKLLSVNGNTPYTTEKLKQVEEIIKKREQEWTQEQYGEQFKLVFTFCKSVIAHVYDGL